ncbi:MAG: hypothetical protein ACP5HG_16005 [Anaerolineae bacterium]
MVKVRAYHREAWKRDEDTVSNAEEDFLSHSMPTLIATRAVKLALP